MRRHAHSCDQCRRSKRACDAQQLVLPEGAETKGPSLLNRNLQPPKTEPCSYCKKTGKTCTMNWAWSQLQLHTAMEAASRGEFQSLETGPDSNTAQKRSRNGNEVNDPAPQPVYHPDNTTYEHFEQNLSSYDPNTIIDFPFPGSIPNPIPNHQPNMMHNAQQPAPGLFTSTPNMAQPIPPGMFSINNQFNPNMSAESDYSDFSTPADMSSFSFNNSGAASDPLSFAFPATMSPSTASNMTSVDPNASDFGFSMSGNSSKMYGTSVASTVDDLTKSRHSEDVDERAVAKRRRTPGSWTETRQTSMSPYAADQTMMKLCTQGIISGSLLQVYHDVLEHNMSCWLTEATCPYDGAWGREEGRMTAEWGSSWSNRIFDRTVKLDMASKGNGLVKLTKAQDNAANRAMNMAVMAFASQWAQGSKRKDEVYAPRKHKALKDDTPQDPFADLADEFDRNLQRHFWNEAQKALNDVSDVESYKVICAEIVFGFAQKPWTQDEIQHSLDKTEEAFKSETSAFDMSDLMTEVTRCIDMDGPPVYMERATRKMQNLKIRSDAAAQAVAKKAGIKPEAAKNAILSPYDQKTGSLLYWLAVMADTISSGMAQRPITVSDEDSMHDLTDDDDLMKGKWKIDLFIKDELANPSRKFHWPCSYEDAADAIAHSSPVKIMLWRSVNHLQGMLRRAPNPARIEELLDSVTKIWKYWNSTYGQFFRELVQSVEAVPVRIRSWFFCVSAHWHLAAFLMVELMERVDEQDLGIPAQKKERTSSRIVATMKQTSVAEVADLAKISLPKSESDPAPISVLSAEPGTHPDFEPEFHHAVKEGTILTEPWTIILVRAFSRAAMVMLSEMDGDRQYGALTSDDKTWISMQRTEYCIKTLFYLGKKSDMSRRVADVLSEAQQALKEAIIGSSVAQNSMFNGQEGYPRMPVPTA